MIELTHVQKVVGQNTVVDIQSLRVDAGESVALVGPVGSGKSAVLSLLTGQSRPTAGAVRVAGLDPVQDRERLSRQVGILFAENALYERHSTRANLTFYCQLLGLPEARADEVLGQVGLVDHAGVAVRRLPSGLARRLAFGRAVLHQPDVLILMEPFNGCDVASANLLSRSICRLTDEGKTVLILTREVSGLSGVCQTVHELEQGRVVRTYSLEAEQPPAELPFKIPARLEDKVALLNPADILFASTEDERTYLHTAEGQLPSHFTLTELEQRLARSGFFRAHRSYLVNLQRVKAVIPYTRDSFSLVLDDSAGTQIPLSKTSARELRELLGY